ncbi:hypothetical protein GCM10011504_24530 [Siccirubricoccus deserti]|uniref:Cupin domain-containing protein n=1 Tax=Siccirubricoccus deserti TaxID=2013562 RepID=A0A9X0QZD3_9PROT|nr:hypothetical protein [Siccirubricoccus deserti]MBC4015862.1 hypothetical protein [Siccirubricoccus deserti]GGC45203.1 hypothetical protein GCM10011504_24530 [Siccirubricoccus deserti]
MPSPLRRASIACGLAVALMAPAHAAEVDPRAIALERPEQIPWGPVIRDGNQQAVLVGDSAKPGFHAVMPRWLPGHVTRPHFHPNDGFIAMLSGTWWMGSGRKSDPDSTVPAPAGSGVTHFARGIHHDGVQDRPAVLLILGEGPGTSSSAETR